MGKRGNGEGSVYKRKDGRWVGQYLVYTVNGPKYRCPYGKIGLRSRRGSQKHYPTGMAA